MNNRVTIARAQSVYLTSHQHPSPEMLRRRLDDVMRAQLGAACEQMLSHVLKADDPGVWLIRQLDVDFAVDIGSTDDTQVGHVWGRRVAASVARTIARGPSGENVLHFSDQAAFLAQFLSDLASGRAWGKWYYGVFDSLRSLPAGAAVREALIREPGHAESTLLLLSRQGQLERVLSAMGAGDAQQVYNACLPVDEGGGQRQVIDALVSAWPTAGLHTSPRVATAHNALRLYVAIREQAPVITPEDGLRTAIDRLLSFAEVLRHAGSASDLIARLSAGDLRGAIERARRDGLKAYLDSLPFFENLASDDAWLAQVAGSISPSTVMAGSGIQETLPQALSTPFGGIFLLLPSLVDLGLHRMIDIVSYPNDDKMAQTQALRYLALLKCLGRARTSAAVNDTVIHFAVGLDNVPDFSSLSGFEDAAAANRICQQLLLRQLARRFDGQCLVVDLVTPEPSEKPVLLFRDAASDTWLYTDYIDGGGDQFQAAFDQGLALIQNAVEFPQIYLIPGEGLNSDELNVADSRAVWLESPGERAALPEQIQASLTRYEARAKLAAEELAYFSLAGLAQPVITDPQFDLTWSLVAHAVLKNFARRLLGFEWSSAEYLYQNFLAGMSLVNFGETQIEVRLPASPLHVVLHIAGVDGQEYQLPWLGEIPVKLSLGRR